MFKMEKRDRTYCCVPQCKSQGSKNPELSFHQFPSDSSKVQVTLLDGSKVLVPRKIEWIRKLRIGNKVSSRAKVCSKHFTPGDYIWPANERKFPRLRPTCVPSCFLPVSENTNSDSKAKQSTKRQEAQHEKLNKEEKAEELTTGASSQWRVYSELKEIMGDIVNLNGCLKDTSTRCEEMPVEQSIAAESGPVTILKLTPKEVNEDGEVYYADDYHEEEEQTDSCSEDDESRFCDEPSSNPSTSSESNRKRKKVESEDMEELYEEYEEIKQSLADTDKKLLELLTYQNDLIKTQNELCRTQNSLLSSLLEKME